MPRDNPDLLDQADPGGENPGDRGGNGRPAYPWLPAGATFDPTSNTITFANGRTESAPPGYQFNPANGQLQPVGGLSDFSAPLTPDQIAQQQQQFAGGMGITGPAPPTDPSGGGGGGGGGGGYGGMSGLLWRPPTPPPGTPDYLPSLPQFTPPQYTPPPAFKPPSVQDALATPGYQFVKGQGESGLQNWAAAKGTLNDSSTANALEQYNQNLAGTYYQTAYQNASNDYLTNYKTQYLDPYNIKFQAAEAQFAPQLLGYQTTAAANQYQRNQSYQDVYNQWLAQMDYLLRGSQQLTA